MARYRDNWKRRQRTCRKAENDRSEVTSYRLALKCRRGQTIGPAYNIVERTVRGNSSSILRTVAASVHGLQWEWLEGSLVSYEGRPTLPMIIRGHGCKELPRVNADSVLPITTIYRNNQQHLFRQEDKLFCSVVQCSADVFIKSTPSYFSALFSLKSFTVATNSLSRAPAHRALSN